MSFTPIRAEAKAREHHFLTRGVDIDYPHRAHPLLMLSGDVKAFPSSRHINKMFDSLCGGPHRNHSRRSPDQCYMSYAQKCDPSAYGPPATASDDYPFSKATLPGKAPIVEHVRGVLRSQEPLECGGNFKPFIKHTLEKICDHRQVCDKTRPVVTTLIFGVSSVTEVQSFIDTFNQMEEANACPPPGHLPSPFYSLDVEHVSGTVECPLKIVSAGGETREFRSRTSLPARVHLGFYDRRFDIVFPWVHSTITDVYTGDYRLHVPAGPLPSLWHDLFAKLSGRGIGIGLTEDLSALNAFLTFCYSFEGRTGPVKVRTVDLLVLLALSGYNTPKTCLSVLNYVFTGGVVQKAWKIRCGMGLWATTAPLPAHLDLYLQSEVHATLNVANVACLTILIHWFVTPGIAGVVSRKTPVRFLAWFSRFFMAVLDGASFPDGNPFQGDCDRERRPRRLIESIQYAAGYTPPVEPGMLALCIPPWRNVTGGGCISDQQAFDHLICKVRAMLRADGVPLHYQWESDLRMIDGFLTGKPSPSARAESPGTMSCSLDPAVRKIPEVLDPSPDAAHEPLRHVLRRYRATLPVGHELKQATVNQLLLLYTWRYPRVVISKFELTSVGAEKFFFPEEYDLIRPLILSLLGREDAVPVPEFYTRFLKNRRISQNLCKARSVQAADLMTDDVSRKRKLREKFRHLKRKLFKSGVEIERLQVSSSTRDELRAEAAVALSPGLSVSSDEDLTLTQAEEVRTVRYASSPSSSDDSDDDTLLVNTPRWEEL